MKKRETTVEPGAIRIWSESFPADGPGCLLIGGAGTISAFWPDSFCQGLAAHGYEVLRYDHRDTGWSTQIDFEAHPYDLADLVADALAVLDATEIQRAHVVGHSMGGFIAQLLAVDHPDRVRSLTSIASHTAGPDVPPPPTDTWDILLANKPTGDFDADLPGYLKVWRHLNGDLPLNEAMATAYTRQLYARNTATLSARNHVAAQRGMRDRTSILGTVHMPTLVIHGEEDPLVPAVGGRLTAEAIPGATFLTLPGAGHVFFNRDTWRTIESALAPHFAAAE